MKYKLLIILIAMFMLNGINNSRELNDLAIVSAIGVDKGESGNYIVTALVVNPLKKDSGSSSDSEKRNCSISRRGKNYSRGNKKNDIRMS